MASSSAAAAAEVDALVHVAFNHDATYFVAATASGMRVFSCSSLEPVFGRSGFISLDGSACDVASAEVLTESFSAIVVRGSNSVDSSSREDTVNFWSELDGRVSFSMTPKRPCGAVCGLRLLGDYVLVVGEQKSTLYEMPNHGARPSKVKEVETGPNPLGLCALAQPDGQAARFVLASPRKDKGGVQVRRRREKRLYVRAHSSTVACIALSRDGRLLATAGSRGTLVRVFSTTDGKLLQELRRGTDRADIHCIAFSPDSKWLAVSSNKATVHIFSVNVDLTSSAPENGDGPDDLQTPPAPSTAGKANQGSSLSFLRGFLPGYFSSEWSLAQFRLREGIKYLVAFGQQPNTVLIIGMDGSFYRCQFDPQKGGDMTQLEYRNFMNIRSGVRDEGLIGS